MKYSVAFCLCLFLVAQPRSCWEWPNAGSILGTTLEGLSSVAAGVADLTVMGFEAAKDAAPDLIQKAREGLAKGASVAKKFAGAAKLHGADFYEYMEPKIKEGAKEASRHAKKAYNTVEKGASELYKTAAPKIKEGLAKGAEHVKNAAESIKQTAADIYPGNKRNGTFIIPTLQEQIEASNRSVNSNTFRSLPPFTRICKPDFIKRLLLYIMKLLSFSSITGAISYLLSWLAGVTKLGPAAGSLFAYIQSWFGAVSAGSVFSYIQSAGMTKILGVVGAKLFLFPAGAFFIGMVIFDGSIYFTNDDSSVCILTIGALLEEIKTFIIG